MNTTAATPPLDTFDFSLLDSSTFKDDSVREEIILPVLHALGYAASGPNKIISVLHNVGP